MYVMQTTTAILIAFLALYAWGGIRNRLAKRRSKNKDSKSSGSPGIFSFEGWRSKATESTHTSTPQEGLSVDHSSVETAPSTESDELKAYNQLYHKLHNLEYHPEILPECHKLLLSLLSSTLSQALADPSSGILSVGTFSHKNLDRFLKEKDVDVTNQWVDYLARRRAGGPREMFENKEEAEWWLKQAAPVKYVDGAWLGHINKVTTPLKYRNITKNAWQVMSEELGDGDLEKNHVYVYRQLMNDIGAGLPAANEEDFIHPRHKLNQTRCWKAAIAQLLISLFPHDFLPESLGFNMAYESLPLHLLKTVKELREVQLNPYYFELHISIDNADSGHAAMAMAAVAAYIYLTEKEQGVEAADTAWKRIQAGYILAEGLPTTPESPSQRTKAEEQFPHTGLEAALLDIFVAKSFVAHKIHCNSRLKIGHRSLVDWLEPQAFADTQWQREFLYDLSNCKPWVVRGNSKKSRLVNELSWEGKMFGSFTQMEVEVVKAWINELGATVQTSGSDPKVYLEFTGQSSELSKAPAFLNMEVLVDYPIISIPAPVNYELEDLDFVLSDLDMKKLNLYNFLPLWFTSPTLLESLPSVPLRAADAFGSALVRVLRAQTGFSVEGMGVAGMDEVRRTDGGQSYGIIELGLQICSRADIYVPTTLKEAATAGNTESTAFSEWMVSLSMRWLTHRDMLIGMSWAFMELHEAIARVEGEDAMLSSAFAQTLAEIARRERAGLEVCKKEIVETEQRKLEFEKGLATARRAIRILSI